VLLTATHDLSGVQVGDIVGVRYTGGSDVHLTTVKAITNMGIVTHDDVGWTIASSGAGAPDTPSPDPSRQLLKVVATLEAGELASL
jgi:hypothetical protein